MSKEYKDLMAHVDRLMAQAADEAKANGSFKNRDEATLNILTGYLKSKHSAYLCLVSVSDEEFLLAQQQPDKLTGLFVLAAAAFPHIEKQLREAVSLLDELRNLEEEAPE